MKTYDVTSFIQDLLIPDLQKMIDHELHYYAFSIICQGIEVLGSVFDQKSIDDFGASESRFDNAITKLFPKNYREKQSLFYSVLRGPLVHQLRPGPGLWIASEKKDGIEKSNHLMKHSDSGSTILIIEQFYLDFVSAFEKFKREINKGGSTDKKKVEVPFIAVSTISPPFAKSTQWWPDTPQPALTITQSITGRA